MQDVVAMETGPPPACRSDRRVRWGFWQVLGLKESATWTWIRWCQQTGCCRKEKKRAQSKNLNLIKLMQTAMLLSLLWHWADEIFILDSEKKSSCVLRYTGRELACSGTLQDPILGPNWFITTNSPCSFTSRLCSDGCKSCGTAEAADIHRWGPCPQSCQGPENVAGWTSPDVPERQRRSLMWAGIFTMRFLLSYLSLVLSLQPDSPLDTSSGLQEGLSLSSVWQVVDEEPGEVHGQVQQGLGQNLDG